MSTTDIKLEIVERLMAVRNRSLLKKLHEMLLADQDAWAPTAAELAELDARRAKRISGKSVGMERSQAIRRLKSRK
ncbi:MAG: hypothetical protein WAT74_06295 [Flavobacteriales bacterium]